MAAVITALAFTVVITAVPFLYAHLLDKAGEAEWAAVDRRWRDDGPSTDVITALRLEVYRRHDMLMGDGRGKL